MEARRCSSLTSVEPQKQKADSPSPQDHSGTLCVFLPQCMLGGSPLHLEEKRTRPGNKSRSTFCSSKPLQLLRVITIPPTEDKSRIPIRDYSPRWRVQIRRCTRAEDREPLRVSEGTIDAAAGAGGSSGIRKGTSGLAINDLEDVYVHLRLLPRVRRTCLQFKCEILDSGSSGFWVCAKNS